MKVPSDWVRSLRYIGAFPSTSGAKNRLFGNRLLPENRQTTAFSRLFFRVLSRLSEKLQQNRDPRDESFLMVCGTLGQRAVAWASAGGPGQAGVAGSSRTTSNPSKPVVRALSCHGEMCPTRRDRPLGRCSDASGVMWALRRRQKCPKSAPKSPLPERDTSRQLEPRHDFDVPERKRSFHLRHHW